MNKVMIRLSAHGNYGGARDLDKIKYIVVHYTGNDGDSALGNARYFESHIVNASAHYFVDDNNIYQSVPDGCIAWSVGGKKYPSCSQTGGGKWNGKCTNNNSISVELCDTRKNGKYDFSEETLKNGSELIRHLMDRYHVPIENVIRHFDVVGKNCPAPFVEDEKKWKAFKERLVEEEVVTKERIIVDGKEWTVDMIRKDGVTYIKTRDIANAVGYKVSAKGKVPVLEK